MKTHENVKQSSKMGWLVKADDPGFIPRTYMMEERTDFYKLS